MFKNILKFNTKLGLFVAVLLGASLLVPTIAGRTSAQQAVISIPINTVLRNIITASSSGSGKC
jgi:hypothetical protein